MTLPFINRNPTRAEFEIFRLILSTYQDGSGQQATKDGNTLPGWRDFERSVAIAFDGQAQENKFIFDVLLHDQHNPDVNFGISCKMRRTLNETKRTGRVTLELSNSSGKFWERMGQVGFHQQNYKEHPLQIGQILLKQVYEWHHEIGLEHGGKVDLSKSCYLALSWNTQGEYQLFKFPISLPPAETLTWDFPAVMNSGQEQIGRRLRGQDESGVLFEWYGESGGQLKYYPKVKTALWKSDIFRLEPLPDDWRNKHGILAKARDYFPKNWEQLG